MEDKKKKLLVIHPFLFAIFPIIFLFSVNVNLVFPETVIFPLFFVVVVTFLIWIALGFLLKNRIKSGFIVSIGLVLFFSYGHIYILLDEIQNDSHLSHFVLIIPGIVLFALSSYFFIRTKKSLNNPTKIVNVIAATLVIISLLGIGEYYFTQGPSNEILSEGPIESSIRPTSAENLPDVYYIILDGYAGSKSLQQILNYDNSEFTDFLINKGFFIATESYSNYRGTMFSIPTTLNMNYLNYLSEVKGIGTNGIELFGISRDNEVVKNFKSEGYTTYAIEAGSNPTNNMKNIDFRLCTEKNFALSDFNSILIRTSILNPIQGKLFSSESRDRILCGFTELAKITSSDDAPKFVLAHLMIPHQPYFFGANGEPINPKIVTLADDNGKRVWNADLYLGQLKFANLKMKEVVSKLTNRNDPPIIIIQSDHGMRGTESQDTYEYEYVLRTFNNFKAYYFPKVGQNIEFETTTPVNSFRVLFNLFFGYEYDLLEDRIYLAPRQNPNQSIDISEILIKNNTMD